MRISDWQTKYGELVRSVKDKPFKWGEHDCCLWAANCTLTITGIDYAKDFRGKYASEEEAEKLIQSLGGLEAIVSNILGLEPVSISYANIADIVLYNLAGKEALGVCNGSSILIPAKDHLANLPLSKALKVWKI